MIRISHHSGLSLLEMLVVLSLISMVTTILFQGYGYMLSNYQRIQLRQADETQRVLANAWFRNNLENLVAYKEPEMRFQATSTSISGTTYSPLLSRQGVPTNMLWELRRAENRQQLYYLEQEQELVIASWPTSAMASFRFRDQQGLWSETWDVSGASQIPTAIELSFNSSSGASRLPVTAVVRTKPKQDKTEEEELRELGF